MVRRLTALLALLWIGPVDAAAVQGRGYPSLQRRPVESRDRDAEVAAQVEAASKAAASQGGDVALAAQVAALGAKADAAGRAFDDGNIASERAVAAAGQSAPGSESWVVAQMQISAQDAARYDCLISLANLDMLYADRSVAGDANRTSADLSTIAPVRDHVLAMVDAQNDRLDRMKALLIQP